MALHAGLEIVSLGIDYGQRHRIELEYAVAQCHKYNVKRHVIRIEWDKPVRNIPTGRSLETIRSGVSPAFLPGRNAVFLVLACAEAVGIGADQVWIGVNAIDFSGYPDCRPEFVAKFQLMIDMAIPSGIKVMTPLLQMSKPQITVKAHQFGLQPGDTWSCYQPRFVMEGIRPCGVCDACILHKHAWKEALHKSGNG